MSQDTDVNGLRFIRQAGDLGFYVRQLAELLAFAVGSSSRERRHEADHELEYNQDLGQ